jgi:hypothetical protein
MDGPGFEALTYLRGMAPSRRALVAVLSGLLTSPWQSGALVGANKKKPKKVTVCLDGLTKRVPKEKKKSLLKHGATSGACTCTTCPDGQVCTGYEHACCPSERVTTHDLGTAHPITSCCPEGYRGDVAGNPGCCESPNSGVCPDIHRGR